MKKAKRRGGLASHEPGGPKGGKETHAHTQGLTAVVGGDLLLLQVVHHFRLAVPGLALVRLRDRGGGRPAGEKTGEDAQRATHKGQWPGQGHAGTVVCVVCVCVRGREKVVRGRGTLRGGEAKTSHS